MNFSFDVVDDTDVFEASILITQSAKSSAYGYKPHECTVFNNLEDSNAALALFFPTIMARIKLHQAATCLHVIRGLGEGTMGRVFLARDSNTSKVFALKVFNKRHVLACEELEHTMTERRCLAETSDNLFTVHLRASFQDRTRLFMLLDFCAGGDLATELSRWAGMMPMASVMYNAAHLVEGIASLHALGIIHRDLKPENILLTVRGHIKISDFGSAARVSASETWIESCTQFGTAAYLPAEVVAGHPHGFSIDWWCLGIIIYEMVLGEHPFLPKPTKNDHVDIEDMQEAICNGEYCLPQTIEPSIRRIIRGFLRTNPEKRYNANDARRSEFFAGWDWELVRQLKYQPPHLPAIHAHDATSNFSPEFTNMSLEDDDTNDIGDPLSDSSTFLGFDSISNI